MIFNLDFDPELMTYQDGYDNALHHSAHFQAYAEELASRLVEQYSLHGKTIVEIGCGDGYFLRKLCRLGGNRGWGFDPSYSGICNDEDDVTIVQEYFDVTSAPKNIDFVCCRHVLEHIPNPSQFMRQLRDTLPKETTVYFEVPNADFTLEEGGIWDILYEHCSYYTENPLKRLFRDADFQILSTKPAYGGQFLQLEATTGQEQADCVNEDATRVRRIEQALQFESSYKATISRWTQRLEEYKEQTKQVAIWGAGTKGIMFLNSVPGASSVMAVVDINPRKHGRFIVGTGTPIVGPSDLKNEPPDVVLVMNPVYYDEVCEQLNDLTIDAEVLRID